MYRLDVMRRRNLHLDVDTTAIGAAAKRAIYPSRSSKFERHGGVIASSVRSHYVAAAGHYGDVVEWHRGAVVVR